MGIYYVGATSCILERFPRLIHDASKIYGASAGALMATVLAVGIPLGKLWVPPPFTKPRSKICHFHSVLIFSKCVHG